MLSLAPYLAIARLLARQSLSLTSCRPLLNLVKRGTNEEEDGPPFFAPLTRKLFARHAYEVTVLIERNLPIRFRARNLRSPVLPNLPFPFSSFFLEFSPNSQTRSEILFASLFFLPPLCDERKRNETKRNPFETSFQTKAVVENIQPRHCLRPIFTTRRSRVSG